MKVSLAAALALLLPVAACGGSGEEEPTLRVFAAASLTDPFSQIAEEFEEDNPGTRVQLNFGPSSGLAQQIAQGAPADVFASASPANMAPLVEAGEAEAPEDFASNSMQIVVPADNPADVDGLGDLDAPGVKVALCQPQVPCGKVAAQVLDDAGVAVRPVTEEVDVKAVLTKVELGEVDAGIVYVTDVRAAGERVRGVEIPEADNESTTYPIAVLPGSGQPRLAREFVDLVLSAAGGDVLADAGFERP
jgi:molybdate transport system substrate-binding protein